MARSGKSFPQLEALGHRITAAVKAAGGSTEIARRADIPLSTLTKYMAGGASPPALSLARIAEVCGVSLESLLAGITDAPSASSMRAARMRQAFERADIDGKMMLSTRVPRFRFREIMDGTMEPDDAFVRLFSQATGMSEQWVWEGEPDGPNFEAEELVYVPHLDIQAAAGAGTVNGQPTVIHRIPLPARTLRRLGARASGVHAIRAKGDSMEPTIADGALVLVDVTRTDTFQAGVFVLVVDDQARLKRLAPSVDGSVMLISDNADYPAERVSKADLDQIKVVGRVIWTEQFV